MTKNWIAVASAEHVRIGRAAGFMQVNHGKLPPLKRIQAGDRVAYYSPSTTMRGVDKLRSFVAFGVVKDTPPYQADMSHMMDGFKPYRRDVAWDLCSHETPITPLLDVLEFSRGNKNWGYQLRFGLFEISNHDMDLINRAMQTFPKS